MINQQIQEATTSALDWEITLPADDFSVARIAIGIASAPTSAGSVNVTYEPDAGAGYNVLLSTHDAQGETEINISEIAGLKAGDVIHLEYTNPDGESITGVANVDF